MKPFSSPLQEVHVMAKLADLQEWGYHNTVVLHAVIDLLIEKGILTREELLAKIQELDQEPDYNSSNRVGRSG